MLKINQLNLTIIISKFCKSYNINLETTNLSLIAYSNIFITHMLFQICHRN